MRLALLLLAGCAGETTTPSTDTDAGVDIRSGPTDSGQSDLPHVEPPNPVAVWAPEALPSIIETALSEGLPDVWRVQDQYLDVLSHGDSACPGHPTYIDDTHLLGCETPDGWYYSGVSEYLVTEGEDGDLHWDGVEALGDILFRSPDDREFEAGGHVLWRRYRDSGELVVRFETELQGSWKWEGHDGWLVDTVSGLYSTSLYRIDDDLAVSVHGAVHVYDVDLSFDSVTLQDGSCGWAPTGIVSVRDPSNAWYALDFGDTCTGCAAASFSGTNVADVCLDLSAIPEHLSERMGDL